MESLLFTVCVMSAAYSFSKQGMGKLDRQPSNAAFVWTEGEISVWGWNPGQTIPPVADKVAGSSALQAVCYMSVKCFLALWSLTDKACGGSVAYLVLVSILFY